MVVTGYSGTPAPAGRASGDGTDAGVGNAVGEGTTSTSGTALDDGEASGDGPVSGGAVVGPPHAASKTMAITVRIVFTRICIYSNENTAISGSWSDMRGADVSSASGSG